MILEHIKVIYSSKQTKNEENNFIYTFEGITGFRFRLTMKFKACFEKNRKILTFYFKTKHFYFLKKTLFHLVQVWPGEFNTNLQIIYINPNIRVQDFFPKT